MDTSDAQAKLEGLKAVWDSCQARDDQKRTLITDLFAYIDDLSGKLAEAESELRDKKDVIKLTRKDVAEGEKQIQALQLEKARHVFASVIIDGDCMLFKDELVKQGLDGGKKTASLLKQAVKAELESSVPAAAPHLKVIVRVYANVKGLAKIYRDMDILSESTLDEFIRGFNMSDVMGDFMCDYVDAGNGKECSDKKVEATFRLHLDDVHCRQILFGGAADNGYARLLEPYSEDEAARGRITLLEGPPFAHELADIKDRFRTVPFDRVFRDQKLVNSKRRVSFHVTPPATPRADYASAAAKATPLAPAPSPAPATAPASAGGINKNTQPSTTPVPTAPPRAPPPSAGHGHGNGHGNGVQQNRRGERVDAPLNYSQQDFVNLKGRKLCNEFHLLGRCRFLENFGQCSHEHGESGVVLSPRQAAALRAVARHTPCPSGLGCVHPACLNGHCCPRDGCSGGNCRFPKVMHNVDTKVVSLVEVSRASA